MVVAVTTPATGTAVIAGTTRAAIAVVIVTIGTTTTTVACAATVAAMAIGAERNRYIALKRCT